MNTTVEVLGYIAIHLPGVFFGNQFFQCAICHIHELFDSLVVLLTAFDYLILNIGLQSTYELNILKDSMVIA